MLTSVCLWVCCVGGDGDMRGSGGLRSGVCGSGGLVGGRAGFSVGVEEFGGGRLRLGVLSVAELWGR